MKPEYRLQIFRACYGDWNTFGDGVTNSKVQGISWAIKARKKFKNHKIRLIEVREKVIRIPGTKLKDENF